MYSADGMVKSMMASSNARVKAFSKLYQDTNGVFSKADFQRVEKELYDSTFDQDGLLKDGFAKTMSEEVALNADVEVLEGFEKILNTFPILKSIVMFPTTRVNQFGVVKTFDPTGLLGLYQDKSFKTIFARTQEQIDEALEMHGMRGATMEEFQMLKSEYIGRKMMTSGAVMTGAMLAAEGRLVGTGPHDPAENKRWRALGGQPFTFNIGSKEDPDIRSYEALPAPLRTFISMVADVTREFTDIDDDIAESWYRVLAATLEANGTNDLFGSEIETINGLFTPNTFDRYFSNLVDSMIPGSGIRGPLSQALAPNIQDVENNWMNYMANRNRWIPSIESKLADEIDVFTGEPVGAGSSPIEILASKLLPGFKTKSGMEPWREWLLSTGWTGLSKPMTNKLTLEELDPPTRQWINQWIGDNLNLDKKVEELMNWDNGKWQKELKRYAKAKGFRSQKDFPLKETFTHEYLDDMMTDAYNHAWEAYTEQNKQMADVPALKAARDAAIKSGDFDKAAELADKVKTLLQTPN